MSLIDLEKFNYFSEERLPQRKTLIYGIIVLIGSYIPLDSLLEKFFDIEFRLSIYILLLVIWVLYWLFNKFHLPRNKKGKIGIVIAIYSENEDERQKLKADFISALKKDLQLEGGLEFSEVIFLKNHFAYQIKECNNPKKKLELMNRKVKAHFYVWWDIKKRADGDEGEKYFVSFQGYVVHNPMPQKLSNWISIEFSKALPSEINFLEKRSFKWFETSAKLVHLAAKYIIGLAAFVSNEPLLAFQLHKDLKEKFNSLKPLPINLQEIRNRIPILISEEALKIAQWHYRNNYIDETKEFIHISLRENNNNYGTWLLQAIIDFRVDKNIDKALKSIIKGKEYAQTDIAWRYSEAFIYFRKGNYKKAINICQKIKTQNYINEEANISEVRDFTLEVLSEENNKPQLHFRIGYLAYFKEGNLANAIQDFERFESLSNNSMDILLKKSSVYLKEIKNIMQIKS